jgi:membrane protease subunit HflK
MTEYDKSPRITTERLYLDAMESVYSKSQKVMVDVENGGNNVLYLPLDRMRGQRTSNPANLDLDNFNYPASGSTNNSSSGNTSTDDARSRGGR